MAHHKDTVIIKNWLGRRSIVLTGLMGAGKTTIGRRLAARIDLPFRDSDQAIEEAAGQKIEDIFSEHGEAHFREGERKVIKRLLAGGPQIMATGGGAVMDRQTRDNIKSSGITVWLRADLNTLMQRVRRRAHRPLLQNDNPEAVMKKLIKERYPVYGEADIVVESRNEPHEIIVEEIIAALAKSEREA